MQRPRFSFRALLCLPSSCWAGNIVEKACASARTGARATEAVVPFVAGSSINHEAVRQTGQQRALRAKRTSGHKCLLGCMSDDGGIKLKLARVGARQVVDGIAARRTTV
jgi:hypothetical protein